MDITGVYLSHPLSPDSCFFTSSCYMIDVSSAALASLASSRDNQFRECALWCTRGHKNMNRKFKGFLKKYNFRISMSLYLSQCLFFFFCLFQSLSVHWIKTSRFLKWYKNWWTLMSGMLQQLMEEHKPQRHRKGENLSKYVWWEDSNFTAGAHSRELWISMA